MRVAKCTRERCPGFRSPTTPCTSAKPKVGGAPPRRDDRWHPEVGRARGHMYPGYGGYPGAWLGRHLLGYLRSRRGSLVFLGGWRDGGGSRGVKKGVGSTDQILEELVVTPKAADEGEGGPGPGLAGEEDVV